MGLLRGLLWLSGTSFALHTRLHTRLRTAPEPPPMATETDPILVIHAHEHEHREPEREHGRAPSDAPRAGEIFYQIPNLQLQLKKHDGCFDELKQKVADFAADLKREHKTSALVLAPAFSADEAKNMTALGKEGYFEPEAFAAIKDLVALFDETESEEPEETESAPGPHRPTQETKTAAQRVHEAEKDALKSTTTSTKRDPHDQRAAQAETERANARALTKEKAGLTADVEALVGITIDKHGWGIFPETYWPNPPALTYVASFHVPHTENAPSTNEQFGSAVPRAAAVPVATRLHTFAAELAKDKVCVHSADVGWEHVAPPLCPHLATANPPCDPTVGDLSAFQEVYTGNGPRGSRFEQIKHIPGALGRNVRICDMERDYNPLHPNLQRATHPATGVGPFTAVVTEANSVPEATARTMRTATPGDVNHGTAVLSMLCGQPRGPGHVGVRGMVHEAQCYWATPYYQHQVAGVWGAWHWDRYDVAMAAAARNALSPGDVYLIEAQQPVCGLGGVHYGPIEETQRTFDAIRMLTRRGITVIEAAGNGGVDFNGAGCNAWRARGDSGAVIVGAIEYTTGNPAAFSSHDGNVPSRVDACALGRETVAGGYGDLIAGPPVSPFAGAFEFTMFSGTSGASPIVASAAVAAQGVAKAHRLAVLRPWTVRELIRTLGDALPGGAVTIGNRVNAENVVHRVLAWSHKCYFCQYATFLAIQRKIDRENLQAALWGRTLSETVQFVCSRLATLAEHDMCKRYIEGELLPTLQQMVAALPRGGGLALTMGGYFEALLTHYGYGTTDAGIAKLANLICSTSLNAVAAPGSTPVPARPVGGVPYVPCVMLPVAIAGSRTGPNTFRAAYVANHKHLTNVHLETFA